MFKKEWLWIKKVFKIILNFYSVSPNPSSVKPSIKDTKLTIELINDKINFLTNGEGKKIDIFSYEKYFLFLEKLGLKQDFNLTSTQDKVIISGIRIKPILINENNDKIIVFCHGVTNNKWSLFYTMHLSLQRGYQVVSYDSRNHGVSGKFGVSLGQNEACDLQDVVDLVKQKYKPEKIGIYGFSMGASTCLFWIGYFGEIANTKVSFVICESPFDYFQKQYRLAVGKGINYYWKEFLLSEIIKKRLNTSYEELEKINPFLVLPKILPVNLLLLHGLNDTIINWKSSLEIYRQLKKNELNKDKIELYLLKYADHGEVVFIGDNVPYSIKKVPFKKETRIDFRTLFYKYLKNNF